MSKITARPAKTFPKAENPRAETVRRSDCREEKVHPSKICQKASSTYFINKKQKYKLHHQVPPTLKYTSLVKNQVACVWSLFSQAPLLRLYFAFKANCQSGSQMTTVPLKGRAQLRVSLVHPPPQWKLSLAWFSPPEVGRCVFILSLEFIWGEQAANTIIRTWKRESQPWQKTGLFDLRILPQLIVHQWSAGILSSQGTPALSLPDMPHSKPCCQICCRDWVSCIPGFHTGPCKWLMLSILRELGQ